jgi:hypothetical protein
MTSQVRASPQQRNTPVLELYRRTLKRYCRIIRYCWCPDCPADLFLCVVFVGAKGKAAPAHEGGKGPGGIDIALDPTQLEDEDTIKALYEERMKVRAREWTGR